MRETGIAAARRAGTHAMSTPLPLPAGGEGPPPTTRAVGCVRARRRWARVRRAGRSLPGLLSLSLSLHLSLSLSPALTHRPPTAACHPTGRRWTAAMGPGGRGAPCAAPCATVVGAHCIFLTKKNKYNSLITPFPSLCFSPRPPGAGGGGAPLPPPFFFPSPPSRRLPRPPHPPRPPQTLPRGGGGVGSPTPGACRHPRHPRARPRAQPWHGRPCPRKKAGPEDGRAPFDAAAAGRPTGRARGQAAMATPAWCTLALDLTIR